MKYTVFSHETLYNYLVDYNHEDPWYKFDILEKEIKYFNGDFTPRNPNTRHIFFCAIENEKIVGIAKLKIGGENSFEYPIKEWISYISVNEKYRNQGISKKLISMIFKYLHRICVDKIIVSGYTKLGLNFLRNEIYKVAKQYNIEVFDKNKVEF